MRSNSWFVGRYILCATATAVFVTEGRADEPVTGLPASPPPNETGARRMYAGADPERREGDGEERVGGIEWKGRVFARAAYEDVTAIAPIVGDLRAERLRLSIPSARLGLKYDVAKWLSLVLEADIADKPLLRDGYVAVKAKHLRGRAGQFKMPVSSINLESPWNLPVARRGIIQGLLHDHMRVLGRRPGFMGSVRGGGSLDPELAVGAFQGGFVSPDGDFDLLASEIDAQNLIGRFSVTPRGQELAVFLQRVSTLALRKDTLGLRHFWAAGADATLDDPFGIRGLRAWLEGMAGRTYYPTHDDAGIPTGTADATYWSARAIVGWRWVGAAGGETYVEPFVLYGVLDPDLDRGSDTLWEVLAGVNVGVWRRTRVTLQLELAGSGEDIPVGLFTDPRISRTKAHKAVVLQVGAAF